MSEQKLIGVQFKPVGKSYHFFLPDEIDAKVGEYVIVNTARGKQIGKVTVTYIEATDPNQDVLSVERKATPRDLILKDMIKEKEAEAVEKAREFLKKPGYEGVKALDAEYSFDSTRLTLFLTYDECPNFNMRNFIREAGPMYPETRLEVRQVGPRDMAKEVSGLGACGIEKRCCSRFLTEFSSISIRMAKSQNVSLTPSEITGICGRLRCCLAYEHENYEEARKLLPKVKKTIQTPLGEGKVSQVLPLTDSVLVYIPEVGQREIKRSELESGKMEDNQPVTRMIEPEEASSSEDVEMVRFDQVGRPPKREDRRPSGNRGRSRVDRAQPSQKKTKEESPDTTGESKERKDAQKGSGRNRSGSKRSKRGPRSAKRVKENDNNNQSG
ncbi:MAG: regulatory iron-sulfur-containing complex subunit RicT [Anaerolineaceae bacterium]|jgi:cell fate regulator YaaT (PSP1 superfamily)